MELHLLSLLLTVALIWPTMFVSTFMVCPKCGPTAVPFPLSTGPDCGDQQYKVRCKTGKLWFDALNDSSYEIISINPQAQRLIIRPPGLANDKTCIASDFRSHGILLDNDLPFNISGSNTIMAMNCSSEVLKMSWNCSTESPCHNYIKGIKNVASACGSSPICCFFKTGGSVTEYKIRVRKERCSAYESFVNLDVSLPVRTWPEPGVEIEWASPRELACKVEADCRDLANSACLEDSGSGVAGQRRCFCRAGFRWDPINGVCQNLKCPNGRVCKKRKIHLAPLVGGLAFAAGVMLVGMIITVNLVYKRRERIQRESQSSLSTKMREDILNANSSAGKSAKILSGKEITRATSSFSKENLLGAGGFGEVFKGVLDDGTITAIKRAKPGNTKGTDQILNEVRILCQVNHRSLVRLLGCCIELDQPMLIYEYISNGTLFDHLHNNSGQWCFLNWERRLTIAHQTAEGLAYLHNSAIPRIYHRDVKSSNILLDEKLEAKVADFGLSRLAMTETSHITTCAQGTLGYLDPEYCLNFQLTDKSDVYSFGVVLLELLTSKKAIDFNREEEDVNLAVYVKKSLREERLMDVIDSELSKGATKVELETMKALGSLAAACLAERRQNRPSMKQVAEEIEYIITIIVANEVPISTY